MIKILTIIVLSLAGFYYFLMSFSWIIGFIYDERKAMEILYRIFPFLKDDW